MSDSRHRDSEGPLARARRFLGRVIETVRGAEHPTELVPAADLVVSPHPHPHGHPPAEVAPPEPEPASEMDPAYERVVELPSVELAPTADEPAAALLADASWSGLRFEDRGDVALLAWRAADPTADTLRVVEIRCAFGALDAEPQITVTDRPASGVIGASTLASDAARVIVSLGSKSGSGFVSSVHASIR